MTTLARSTTTQRPGAPGRALNVVHGVLSLDTGGLERLVLDLVREGCRRGHQVSVVCIERRGQLANLVEDAGGNVYSLDKPPGRSPQAISQTMDLLSSLAPHVVHTHQIGALWYLGQAARQLKRIAVVHTEHSDHVAHARGWLGKLRARLLWRQAAPLTERFCCVSEDVARSVRRWGTVSRSKVDVVLNGIDLSVHATTPPAADVRSSLGIPAGAFVIGTVGRLAEVKRQDLLLQAFAALRCDGRNDNTRLLIVGDGPERQALEQYAARLGVREQTIFAGYQERPERLLKAMDLFVLTSRHEGLPLSLLEAWAAGLATVCSAVGAIPQTVMHGVSGMLFASGDVIALRDTLAMLLESPQLVSQLGRRGQERVAHRYSLSRMADEYERRYRLLISQGPIR